MTRTIDHGPARGTDTFAWDAPSPVDASPTDGHPMRHPADGRCHFSELKQHARSPAHVRLACTEARETTRAMRVGHIADGLVFQTGKFEVYDGKRVGAAYKLALDICKETGKELVTQSEYDDAAGAAAAVLADPVATALLAGCEFQRVAQWEAHGLPCAAGIAGERGGFDAVRTGPVDARMSCQGGRYGDVTRRMGGYIADLKVTADVEPRALQRQAWRMFWVAQGAWYLDGARAMGLDVADFYLIAVESAPPHCVTVMRLSAESLEVGRRQVAGWAERHRQCEAAGVWPGFTQSAVELEPEAWMVGQDGDE
jgi:hypothetical protein